MTIGRVPTCPLWKTLKAITAATGTPPAHAMAILEAWEATLFEDERQAFEHPAAFMRALPSLLDRAATLVGRRDWTGIFPPGQLPGELDVRTETAAALVAALARNVRAAMCALDRGGQADIAARRAPRERSMRDDPLAIAQARYLFLQGLVPIAVIALLTGVPQRVIPKVAEWRGWRRGASPRIRAELSRLARELSDRPEHRTRSELTHDATGKRLNGCDLARLKGAAEIGRRWAALDRALGVWLGGERAGDHTELAVARSLRRLGGLMASLRIMMALLELQISIERHVLRLNVLSPKEIEAALLRCEQRRRNRRTAQ